jgi:hypothetical protein
MTQYNGGTQALKVLTGLMQSQWSKPCIHKTALHSKLGTHQDFITMELMFLLCKYLNMVNLQMSLNSNSNPNSSSSASHEAKHCPIPNLHGHFLFE